MQYGSQRYVPMVINCRLVCRLGRSFGCTQVVRKLAHTLAVRMPGCCRVLGCIQGPILPEAGADCRHRLALTQAHSRFPNHVDVSTSCSSRRRKR
jgi:hypothetical protein